MATYGGCFPLRTDWLPHQDGKDDDDGEKEETDLAEALEEAVMALGYDDDDASRAKLAELLGAAVDGPANFPEDLSARVARQTGMTAGAVGKALKRQAKPMLMAVTQAIDFQKQARTSDCMLITSKSRQGPLIAC